MRIDIDNFNGFLPPNSFILTRPDASRRRFGLTGMGCGFNRSPQHMR